MKSFSRVEACTALIDERHQSRSQAIQALCNICIRCEIGFRSDGISSHGPSKGVCPSPSSFFRYGIDEDDEKYSQHDSH